MEHRVNCPRCDGWGVVEFEEDDHLVQDACYHCYGSGVLVMEDDEFVEYVNELITECSEAESM